MVHMQVLRGISGEEWIDMQWYEFQVHHSKSLFTIYGSTFSLGLRTISHM